VNAISLFAALGAGVLSFFSPCVLPLIPVYISFITGLSLDKLGEALPQEVSPQEILSQDEGRTVTKNVRRYHLKRYYLKKIFWETVLFVLGFSFIFVALGASATYLGNFVFANRKIIKLIGGIIIILLGLHIAGVFKIKHLEYEKKFHLRGRPPTLLGSFVVGIVFAVGWTPCIGPLLAGILALAATKDTLGQGVLLLSFYSLGLAIPFLLTSIFIGGFLGLFSKIKRHFRLISIVSGGLLISVGIWVIISGLL